MTDKSSKREEVDEKGAGTHVLPVVGIGASAGGLAALKELFDHMPADTGLAFVVVVHLSPEHESHLADLLQSSSSMPVTQVTGTLKMQSNHIYVIPPGANLTAVDTHLRLSKLEQQRRERAPIDHFFRTLAETHHETAVGVILTGTGSDGTIGLRMIREKGGLTVAQDPAEAEYAGMPQSAIAGGIVDLVLPLAEMPEHIVRFSTTEPDVPVLEGDDDVESDERRTVFEILTPVHTRTGNDFTRYKPATVMRRIRKRMQILQIEDLKQYAENIHGDQEEAQRLFDDLLITVTSFFRDQETFAALERDVFPGIFSAKRREDRVRVWSVGCATGEEAYSLAMLLIEQAARVDWSPEIQVFATDIHLPSLQYARDGLYPETIESDVTPERLRHFFVRQDDHYRVRPELREKVVFAPHNLMKDPPFSQLDLISCRNMLIYLQREAQQEILPLLHYALRPDGYLLLGSSEKAEQSELFNRTDKSPCIFRRRDVRAREPRLPAFQAQSRRSARGGDLAVPRRPEIARGYGGLHQRMVEQYAPPSVLVNENDTIVHSSARAGKYLAVPGGEPTNSVFRLILEPLHLELRAGLFAARERGEAYCSKPVKLTVDGEQAHVMVRVQPAAADDEELSRLYLVILDELPFALSAEHHGDGGAEGTFNELEEELTALRARLQTVMENHESNQEEMRASNEELQSMNEELRSTMEELETSKEELQSINEELTTVNQENRNKVEELAQLSSDLQNLLSSTDIATLFLDRELRIMRFTRPLAKLFNVRPADRGRAISDFTHYLGDVALDTEARKVLDTLVPLTREVQSVDGRWFLTRLLPYRSTDNRIDGVVITFVDITELRQAEEEIRKREARLAAEAEALARLNELSDRLWHAPGLAEGLQEILDATIFLLGGDKGTLKLLDDGILRIAAKQGFDEDSLDYFDEVDPEEDSACGRELMPRDLVVIEDVETDEAFEPSLPAARSAGYRAVTTAPLFGIGGTVLGTVSVHFASPHRPSEQELDRMTLYTRQAAGYIQRQRVEEARRRSEEKYRSLFDSIDEGFCTIEVLFDEQGKPFDYRFLEANRAFVRQSGYEDAIGRTVRELTPEHETFWYEIYGQIAETGEPQRFEHEAKGVGFYYDVYAFRIGEEGANRVAVLFNDITERKKAEEQLSESEKRFRAVSNLVPDLVWRSDATGYTSWYNGRWSQYTGQTEEEALGWGWVDAVHPDDRAQSRDNYCRAAQEGKPLEREHRIRRHDGEYRWFLVRADPLLNEDGGVRDFFGSATDIHAQRTAMEVLEERVEERTQEVRELARTLSVAEQGERRRIATILHDDLQQLLFGVQLRLGYLTEDVAELDNPKLKKGFKQARDWIGTAITHTRDLSVDLSPPVSRDKNLSEALGWLVHWMREKHQLEVDLRVEDESRVDDADSCPLLFQVVRELLFNVVKHAGVHEATVALSAEDGNIRLEVSDSGSGFNVEAMRSSSSRQTGLGLVSVRERVRLIGGTVEIDTAPGQGTRIRIAAPVHTTRNSNS